jgi:two-component system, oxyanion-binding sensor
VRDRLNIGLFDAAHLLSPVAIASSLGVGHVRVRHVAVITVTPDLSAICPTIHRLAHFLRCTMVSQLTVPVRD